ncbi:MAG: adenylyl-sulfate kinase [Desulfobulbus sp.]|nr:adenylyl-sulfate kinase [Desulfobulbus sp.]
MRSKNKKSRSSEAAKSDFTPFASTILSADRHRLNGHRSALVWFTGLSGSGKSTLAHALEERLFVDGVRGYVLDGDNIRQGLNKDLGLSPEDRKENIRRIAEVAKLMVDAGILTFAAFIAPYRESRRFIRSLMRDWPYYECYVKCPLAACEARDPKGLYAQARASRIDNMTGITAPYEEPENPDLTLETDRRDVQECVDILIRFLMEKDILTLASRS